MAVSDNLGLYLPTREDYISVTRDITNNMINIDGAVGGVMGGALIVCDGDTHIAITSGQYVHVRNNAHGLTEGWYTASANIAANAQIDSTNCDPAPSVGILNALNGNMASLSTQITNVANKFTLATVSDWNNALPSSGITVGFYFLSSTASNRPANYAGFCLAFKYDGNTSAQLAIVDGKGYSRKYSFGTWGSWNTL